MKKEANFYIDMDGVLNLFESDKNARINMWTPGYFRTIPVRPGISDLLVRINSKVPVTVLSKVIERVGVTDEKDFWVDENISPHAYSNIIYVPYNQSKSDYIYTKSPCILVDDKEENLIQCARKGCHGLYFSDTKLSQGFPTAKCIEDIWNFFLEFTKNL